MIKKKKKRGHRLWKGMALYAVVFLILTAAGLAVLWNFIDAYEQSRPKNTVDAFLETLTPEKLSGSDGELLAGIDPKLQTEEQARQVIRDAVTGDLSYAKKSSESTEDRQVYVIRSGRQVIGEVAITAGEPDRYGFRVWQATDSSFDFSWLLSESVSVTVPESFTVSVNGNVLDEGYVTGTGIQYSALEEFYGDYELPVLVTYTAGPVLGELVLETADGEGNPVVITGDTDYNAFLGACTDEETADLEELVNLFVTRYIAFTGSSNKAVQSNYYRLCETLVPGGALAARLKKAFDGLTYAQSNGDKMQELTMNRAVDLGDGRYLCDFTYTVETVGKKGAVQTVTNMKTVIVETEKGLRVEAIANY